MLTNIVSISQSGITASRNREKVDKIQVHQTDKKESMMYRKLGYLPENLRNHYFLYLLHVIFILKVRQSERQDDYTSVYTNLQD